MLVRFILGNMLNSFMLLSFVFSCIRPIYLPSCLPGCSRVNLRDKKWSRQ